MDEEPIKYRKAALKHFSSVSKLGQPINTITTKSWIILLSISLIIITIVAWGFFGNIPTYVIGKGILVEKGGRIYTANSAGLLSDVVHIKEIMVKPGDKVRKNQIVAKLDDSSLHSKMLAKQNYVIYLQNEDKELSQDFASKNKVYQANLTKHNIALKRIIKVKTEHLVFINSLLDVKRKLLAKGYSTKISLGETLKDYHQTKYLIEQSEVDLVRNKINADDFVDQWHERLRDLELKIRAAQHDLAELEEQLKTIELVRSPINGIVVGVLKSLGDAVRPGDAIVSMATGGSDLDALIYLNSFEAKRVKVNMQALVSPATVKREEYGSIKGTVIEASIYPTTENAMMAVLHNAALVKSFLEEGTPIAIRITLEKNANNYSGLQWTSSKGPKQKVTPGTLAVARITVRKQAPISLVIPAFKKLLRIE